MKKIFLPIIIFLQLFNSLLAINVSQDSFYMKFNAFWGTDYFYNRNYKSLNYFDKQDYYAGWKYNLRQNIQVWLDLAYNDKFYDKEILLHSTGINLVYTNFTISYQISRLKYGADSKVLNILVKDSYYDCGVLEYYHFNGVEVKYKQNNMMTEGIIAADDFHSLIVGMNFDYHCDVFFTKFFYLYVGNNEEYNEQNHSFGLETSINLHYFDLNASADYQYLPEYFRGDKLKMMFELNSKFDNNFSFGSNLFLEKFVDENAVDWQSQSYLNVKLGKFENYVLYRIDRIEEFTTNYTNNEYSILSMYKFNELFGLGINYSYFTPDFDQDYQQIGFQVEFNYEKDI